MAAPMEDVTGPGGGIKPPPIKEEDRILDVAVVGAGLAGLTTALSIASAFNTESDEQATHAPIHLRVFEARNRIGGRIFSNDGCDMGGTWARPSYTHMLHLASLLKVETHPQYTSGRVVVASSVNTVQTAVKTYQATDEVLRFEGGAHMVCKRIIAVLGLETVIKSCVVTDIHQDKNLITLNTTQGIYRARYLIIAIAPMLYARVKFMPELSQYRRDVMQRTPTWMAGVMKMVIKYRTAFWRDMGLSGTGAVHAPPLMQIFDGSTPDGTIAALEVYCKGKEVVHLAQHELRSMVLERLEAMFGDQVAHFTNFLVQNWYTEEFTCAPPTEEDDCVRLPSGHHPMTLMGNSWLRQPWGRVHWAGAETQADHPGMMEGAVISGLRAAAEVARRIQEDGLTLPAQMPSSRQEKIARAAAAAADGDHLPSPASLMPRFVLTPLAPPASRPGQPALGNLWPNIGAGVGGANAAAPGKRRRDDGEDSGEAMHLSKRR